MNHFGVAEKRISCAAILVAAFLFSSPSAVKAQDEAGLPDTTAAAGSYASLPTFAGQFTPGSGFDILDTERGSINLSLYGLFRYLNQMPGDQTFTDHLGRERRVATRNDINWHRTMLWVSGFFYNPNLRYTITVWSLPSTEQTLAFGLLRYIVSKPLTFGAGIGPSLTARSMQGSWPFWAGSDRQMSEEFYRGGFASSFFVTGSPIDRFYYTAAINRSLSQLGITAANDNRSYAYSGSVWVMPTTGEFGPRGGFGDLEEHQELATRFGISGSHAREGRYAGLNESPRHAQIRLSDGVNPFEADALAEGVTVLELDYNNLAFDAGFKYKGFSFQTEYGLRWLSDFDATGPLPQESLFDHGFYAEAMHMVIERRLGLYATSGYVFDDFKRNPWELGGGASLYPFGNRNFRLNVHCFHVDKSPTGSSFGYYTAGQTGTTLSIGTDILL
jgi:hypothetical protein